MSSGADYPRVQTVIFDLDGTLTDPFAGITGCLSHALDAMGVVPPSPTELARFIGPPIRESFATLLNTADSASVEAALAHYRSRYEITGLLENELYPGIPEVLETLRQRGFRLYVATSKLRALAVRIARHFGIAEAFDGIYGAEEGGRFDDKRELLPHLVEVEGLVGAACVMVGDRKYDVEAGKVIGSTVVGVTYGFGSAEELTTAGADHICASPPEIAELRLLRRTPAERIG